jgi:hypothetical protein
VVALLYLGLSSPFLLNLAIPSIHEGNIYSFFFVIFNMPVIYLLGGIIDTFMSAHMTRPTLYSANVIFITVSWCFWVLLAWLAGSIMDLIHWSRKKHDTVHIS